MPKNLSAEKARNAAGADVLSCGNVIFSREQQKVFIGKTPIPMNRAEASIVCTLLKNGENASTYEDIYNCIRGEAYDGTPNNAVRSAVKRLRKRIAAVGLNPNTIVNVRGVGYLIAH
ncbi:MAG: winged helix-turn-helix domain-containing protein [Firmicutes bacterium]|nr:winged helix-turn-helix domain-containing protein [Bacillota bacterium]